MIKPTPYISLDLESTDLLTPHTQVLQLAMVIDDFTTQVDQLQTFNFLIKNDEPIKGSHYALQLNSWILKELSARPEDRKTDIPIVTLDQAKHKFSSFLEYFCKKYDLKKVNIAGKNVAGFDLRILEQNGFEMHKIAARTIDPGSMFFKQFGKVPSLDEINKFLSRQKVSHNALEDSLDVIHAIRYHYNNG
jgi:hypothetical protein